MSDELPEVKDWSDRVEEMQDYLDEVTGWDAALLGTDIDYTNIIPLPCRDCGDIGFLVMVCRRCGRLLCGDCRRSTRHMDIRRNGRCRLLPSGE